MEPKVAQILAILPHLSQACVARLLRDDRFGENVEHVLEGLLDGSLGFEHVNEQEDRAVEWNRKGKQKASSKEVEEGDAFGYDISQRKNLFDDEELDITRLKLGKRDVGCIITHLFCNLF